MTVMIPLGILVPNAGGVVEVRITYTIWHVNAAGSETEIVAETIGDTILGGGANEQDASYFCIREDMTNEVFQIGEKLRITLQIQGRNVSGNVTQYGVGHDPKNRDGSRFTTAFATGDSTILQLNLPIKPAI